MSFVPIILTFLAALTAFIAKIKSNVMIPSSRIAFSRIYTILDPLLWSQEKLIKHLKEDVESNGGISGNKQSPSLSLLNALNDSLDGVVKSQQNLKESGLNDISLEANRISEVRIYQTLSWVLAAIATVLQLLLNTKACH